MHEVSRRGVLKLGIGGLITIGTLQVQLTPAHAETLSEPLRSLDKGGLHVADTPSAVIENARHRVTFYEATWADGQTFLRHIEVVEDGQWHPVTAPNRWFDEQWVVFTGTGQVQDYYTSMTPGWVSFEACTQLDANTVELQAVSTSHYELSVRWTITDTGPRVDWTVTANTDSDVVVGYQSFDVTPLADVDELLCGVRQHAKVVYGPESLGAWELMAPMSLAQRDLDGATTIGLFIPADHLPFEHEVEPGAAGQPYGMSLRNGTPDVIPSIQPVGYAPQFGDLSPMVAGESRSFAFGICAERGALYDAYTMLVRKEYDYSGYRRNVFETSLTQALFNLIDLVKVDPDDDDSTTFVASPSGWWNRGKGFANVEGEDEVRTASAGMLLSAAQLTGDTELYRTRARPTLEYHVSRTGVSSSPVLGRPIVGNSRPTDLCSYPGDAATLVPLYLQTRGHNAGVHALAMDAIRARPRRPERYPMTAPYEAHLLTSNPAYLAELRAQAQKYAQTQVDVPYNTSPGVVKFYQFSMAWTELLLAYEATGETSLLDSAYREVKRFVTGIQVRPLPEGTVTVPEHDYIDWQMNRWVDTDPIWEGPYSGQPPRLTVPAWTVSTNGAAFEAIRTLQSGMGFTKVPSFAPFLLRLAQYTNDDLLADVAHNLVIGRYTNYPGYYYRQFEAWTLRPEFPYEGPTGIGDMYYNHIAPQIGLTIDYLFEEQRARSGGQIDFGSQFEVDYAFFKGRTYGHAPGTFYGETGVWPYLPKGILTVSNPQVNWLTAVGNDSLYVSLANEHAGASSATLTFDPALTGIDPGSTYDVEIVAADGIRTFTTMTGGTVSVRLKRKGLRSVIVRGVGLAAPMSMVPELADRSSASYHFNDSTPVGSVRAMAIVRPDRTGYDVYVQVNREGATTLRHSLDGGQTWSESVDDIHPVEWTVSVDGMQTIFTYQVVAGGAHTEVASIQLPPLVLGTVPEGTDVAGQVVLPPDTTPGDDVPVTVRVFNGTEAPLSDADVSLSLPSGWTAVAAADNPVEVPAAGDADWTFMVTSLISTDQGSHPISANVTWSGGSTPIEPLDIEVLTPLLAFDITAEPRELEMPGDSTTVTVSIVNRGPVHRTGDVALEVPRGWSVAPTSAAYSLDGRDWTDLEFAVTSASTAQPGRRFTATATGPDGIDSTIAITTAGIDEIVTIETPWPLYIETGLWSTSSLKGYPGAGSRFSREEELGGTATFVPDIPRAGQYQVAVWYPTNAATTTEANYEIDHAEGTSEVVVNQQEGADDWRVLGVYTFQAGTSGSLRLVVDDTAFHRVSAARFRPVSTADLAPTISALSAAAVAAPGGTTTLTATVTAGAAPLSGEVVAAVPEGWSVAPSSAPVDLMPGASQEVSFVVDAAADAAVGNLYELLLTAGEVSDSIAVAVGEADESRWVIVDNSDAARYAESGTWRNSSLLGHDGEVTRYGGGLTGAAATWVPPLSTAGRYQISVWYPSNGTTTTGATYDVVTSTDTVTRIVNQKTDVERWRPLGLYTLDPASAAVTLTAINAGHHRADAIRVEPVVPAAA